MTTTRGTKKTTQDLPTDTATDMQMALLMSTYDQLSIK
jgi:hypothetical protein